MDTAPLLDRPCSSAPVTSLPDGLALRRLLLLCGLSASIGWGIRGNFGHEHGAMLTGALGGMAAVLLSGRRDWLNRILWFAVFGAIGWGFGGSISYMQVIGYTHSGHALSVFYGVAMLFVIGFLWGAIGGAGMALPAFLSRERLLEFVVPGLVLFGALVAQDFAYDPLNAWLAGVLGKSIIADNSAYRHDEPLYWLDTDWTSFLVSILALGILALVRRRWDRASSLLMHMCVGWFVAFLLFPNLLGLRMTPPRGDSWAGCVGIVGGLWVYFQRNGLSGATWASLSMGIVGGFGFAGATVIKLLWIKTGWETNWHSVLEQTYGFINGLAIGGVMYALARRAPDDLDAAMPAGDPGPQVTRGRGVSGSATPILVLTLLALIPWLNIRKNSEDWVKNKAFPENLYWLPTAAWHNLGWIAFAGMLLVLVLAYRRRPIAAVPPDPIGRGQWLYLIFLWIMAVGNFERALPGFREQRLITEGVIFLNAMICSVLVLLWPGPRVRPLGGTTDWRALLRGTISKGAVASALFILLGWGVIRMVWGDTFAGHSGKHIRFGPNATTFAKPKSGQPHP